LAKPLPLRHKGNDSLFTAVEMSLISTMAGVPLHVHAEGLRGTGKTTVMRWAKNSVPRISRLKDCPYHCEPKRPHCPLHRETGTTEDGLVEEIPMPFVEIGHGAKLGTILGSIDLEKLTDSERPHASLLPGSIPMANRGIIFIDEVNRLAETAPEITDVLLSVMGTKPGRVKVEEVGLAPFEIEVTASVWAASNPDEDPGPLEDIRRQLADRFDLVVPVQRPQDASVVERILSREGEQDSSEAEKTFLKDAAEKAARLGNVVVPRSIVRYLAQLYIHRNVESLRAVEALELSSRLAALIAGKTEVSFDELLVVVPLVLRHRVEPLTLSEILKDLEIRRAAGNRPTATPPPTSPDEGGSSTPETDAARRFTAIPPSVADKPARLPAPVPRRDGLEGEGGEREATAAGSASPSLSVAEGTRQGWLQQALARYRASLRNRFDRLGSGAHDTGSTAASRHRRSAGPGTHRPATEYVPVHNTGNAVPVSPAEQARRLSALPWDQLVTPPEWED
jgi:magnesium chelatase subunit I